VTLAAFIVFVVAVLVIVVVNAWSLYKSAQRERSFYEADQGRQDAIYKQQKASQAEIARLGRQVEVSLDAVHASQEAARLSHARVDGFFSHPEVKRMLDAGASGRGG
jgi:ABC-type nickel/cobalt efflux system permease component RcnA